MTHAEIEQLLSEDAGLFSKQVLKYIHVLKAQMETYAQTFVENESYIQELHSEINELITASNNELKNEHI